MKHLLRTFLKNCAWLMAAFVITVAGCGQKTANSRLQLVPLSNQHAVDLSVSDVIEIMRRTGFSDEQIAEFGKKMRDGLSLSGATQLKVGDNVEAIFAVRKDCVYITTRMRGSFIYNVRTGWVTPSPQS